MPCREICQLAAICHAIEWGIPPNNHLFASPSAKNTMIPNQRFLSGNSFSHQKWVSCSGKIQTLRSGVYNSNWMVTYVRFSPGHSHHKPRTSAREEQCSNQLLHTNSTFTCHATRVVFYLLVVVAGLNYHQLGAALISTTQHAIQSRHNVAISRVLLIGSIPATHPVDGSSCASLMLNGKQFIAV